MNEQEIVKALSVLGLKPGATVEECHIAWRAMSKQCHPDMHPPGSTAQQEAIEKQRAVNAAHDLVKTVDLGSLPVAHVEVRMSEAAADPPEIAFEKARGLEKAGEVFAAVDAYKRLAHGGLAKAQFRLGYIYFDSIVKDLQQAALWWKRAADQGHRSAQYNLGLMYEQGLGVAMDPKQAHQWFVEAAKNGDPAARAKIGQGSTPQPVVPTATKPVAEAQSTTPSPAAPAHGATGEQAGRAFIQRKNKK